MHVVDLREATVLTYSNVVFFHNDRYENGLSRRFGLAIGAENMQILFRERKTAAWKDMRLF